jgi:hypothetical protein
MMDPLCHRADGCGSHGLIHRSTKRGAVVLHRGATDTPGCGHSPSSSCCPGRSMAGCQIASKESSCFTPSQTHLRASPKSQAACLSRHGHGIMSTKCHILSGYFGLWPARIVLHLRAGSPTGAIVGTLPLLESGLGVGTNACSPPFCPCFPLKNTSKKQAVPSKRGYS